MTRTITAYVAATIMVPATAPKTLRSALRVRFTYSNPEFYKKKNMGHFTGTTDRTIKTYVEPDGKNGPIYIPRGGISKLRELAADEGLKLVFRNRTHNPPKVDFPRFCIDPDDDSKKLYPYQREAVDAAVRLKQGIIRVPTGGGKSVIAFALMKQTAERTIVMVNDSQLAEQWVREAEKCLGLKRSEVGIVKGGRKYKPGKQLTIALVQSLYAKKNNLSKLLEEEQFGMVIFDEVQRAAARTMNEVISHFPSAYRIGLSADETRKDKKEFLVYDQFGKSIYEVTRQFLEQSGFIHPVDVRMVPTNFSADWYVNAPAAGKDWNQLLDEMTDDAERGEVIHEIVAKLAEYEELPALIFSHRRDHAEQIACEIFDEGNGVPCGLMMGKGKDASKKHLFEEARDRLVAGDLGLAVGTFKSLGVGINIPNIIAGILTTPIGKNEQYFGQVRGRICRIAKGKDRAVIYYLWDVNVFPDAIRHMLKWNDGRVDVLENGHWVHGSKFK